MSLFQYLAELESKHMPFATATIIDATQNSPGRTAFKMAVTPDGKIVGSIGGGALEHKMRSAALEMLRNGERTRVIENRLQDVENGGIGMACGGEATVMIEAFFPAPPLYIFGGGHIGTFLTRYAADCGFEVTIIDARPDFATLEGHPGAAEALCMDYKTAALNVEFKKNAYFVVVTHQHIGDEDVVRGLAQRPEIDAKYIGCIGSSVKLARIFRQMMADGISREALANVHAPIGLDNGGTMAAEIAVSIMAQLTAVQHGKFMQDAMSAKKHPLMVDPDQPKKI